MKALQIKINNLRAELLTRGGAIVCDNSDYKIVFTFDEDWESHPARTARFIWNGAYKDVPFEGDEVEVPKIANAREVLVGVYADDIKTTTPAVIPCRGSIKGTSSTGQPDVVQDYRDQAAASADKAELAAQDAQSAKEAAEAAAKEVNASVDAEGGRIPLRDETGNLNLPNQTLEGFKPTDDQAISKRYFDKNVEEFRSLASVVESHGRRLTNLEQNADFVTEEVTAYRRIIPPNACPYIQLNSIGGMTYRDEEYSLLRDSKVTAIRNHGANLLNMACPSSQPSDVTYANTTKRIFQPNTYIAGMSRNNLHTTNMVSVEKKTDNSFTLTTKVVGFGLAFALWYSHTLHRSAGLKDKPY